MATNHVRTMLCAFTLLIALAWLPNVAWADGPQCETDPTACIPDPCEEDPELCGDPDPEPEPDPGCGVAQSASDATKRIQTHQPTSKNEIARLQRRMLANKSRLGVARLLKAPESFRPATDDDIAQITATGTKLQAVIAASSCPDPDVVRRACVAMARTILDAMMAACLSQWISDGFNIFVSPEQRDERYSSCVANATQTYHNIMETCYAN